MKYFKSLLVKIITDFKERADELNSEPEGEGQKHKRKVQKKMRNQQYG